MQGTLQYARPIDATLLIQILNELLFSYGSRLTVTWYLNGVNGYKH